MTHERITAQTAPEETADIKPAAVGGEPGRADTRLCTRLRAGSQHANCGDFFSPVGPPLVGGPWGVNTSYVPVRRRAPAPQEERRALTPNAGPRVSESPPW